MLLRAHHHDFFGLAMSGSPDEAFAKIFEFLNAFKQLDKDKQRAFLELTEPPAHPAKPAAFVPDVPASEPLPDKGVALNIAAAMAKRIK